MQRNRKQNMLYLSNRIWYISIYCCHGFYVLTIQLMVRYSAFAPETIGIIVGCILPPNAYRKECPAPSTGRHGVRLKAIEFSIALIEVRLVGGIVYGQHFLVLIQC